jgi:hypothetical protein
MPGQSSTRATKAFLDPVAQDIAQPVDLRRGLVADHDRLVAARPDLVLPSSQTADLAGHVGLEVAHELGHAFGIGNPGKEVVLLEATKNAEISTG